MSLLCFFGYETLTERKKETKEWRVGGELKHGTFWHQISEIRLRS